MIVSGILYVLGFFYLCVFILSLVFWSLLLYGVFLIRLLFFITPARALFLHAYVFIVETWSSINIFLIDLVYKNKWEINNPCNFNKKASYLIVSNHQSLIDILLFLYLFNRKIPMVRFFTKSQLIWVPFLGLGLWILDFPIMKRYSAAQKKRNPHLSGKDLLTAQKAVNKIRDRPLTLINFLEGTRITQEKHERQNSPFKHLLKPRAGGIATTINSLPGKFDRILNVTIVYSDGKKKLWDFLRGKMNRLVIKVDSKPIPKELLFGDYSTDEHYKRQFQIWVNRLWQEKDDEIDWILKRDKL
ncbi:MAG: acetyltransferase [Deltaproteobacteria bacterium]|nr:acetyltransferase [Deltaproteobacteria bacterium]